MKKITCYDCENLFTAETSKEMLDKLYAHYMSQHADIIMSAGEEEKKAWREKFDKDWEVAEIV